VTQSDPIADTLRHAAGAGAPALVGFLTAGFPDRESFVGQLAAIAAVADVVEIGVPFSDPAASRQRLSRAASSSFLPCAWAHACSASARALGALASRELDVPAPGASVGLFCGADVCCVTLGGGAGPGCLVLSVPVVFRSSRTPSASASISGSAPLTALVITGCSSANVSLLFPRFLPLASFPSTSLGWAGSARSACGSIIDGARSAA
jgi:hypothetical protein